MDECFSILGMDIVYMKGVTMDNNKVWTKEFICMAIIASFSTIIFFLFIVTIVPYATKTFEVSISLGGLAASIFVVGSLVGRILAGKWSYKKDVLKILEYSLVALILIGFGYFIAFSIEALFIIRLLHGVAAGIISTVSGTISILAVPPSRRAEGIAYFSTSAVIGAALGPFLGILFLKLDNGYQWMFMLNCLLAILSYAVLRFAKLNVSDLKEDVTISTRKFSFSQIIEPKSIPISVIALLIGFSFSGVTSFLVIYCKEINLVEFASYYFIVHAVCICCTRFFTGRLIDLKGANVIIYPCLISFSAGLLIYSQVSNAWMFFVAAALMSTGFGNFNSGANSVAVQSVPNNRIGIATSTYFIFMDIGSGMGPYVLGRILEVASYQTMYLITSVLGGICIFLYYIMYGRKESLLLERESCI